jgi:chemotaxis protein methyltransferase CheR
MREHIEEIPSIDGEMSGTDFERFRRIVYDAAGIALGDGKRELLRARLCKVMRRRGIRTFGEYLKIVEADTTGDEITDLLDAVSTNVTSFFREGDHFRFVEEVVLPEIRASREAHPEKKIRVWSAGCSTGEEPYTIAITLLEAVDGGKGWDIRILATDLSSRVVETARNGVYPKEKLNGVPPALLSRYFQPENGGSGNLYRVNPALRSRITFARLNLLEEYPFRGPFDFIFCRNVMIYFDKPTQKALVDRFARYLSEGGYLFLGHAESLNGVSQSFRFVRPSVYRVGAAPP